MGDGRRISVPEAVLHVIRGMLSSGEGSCVCHSVIYCLSCRRMSELWYLMSRCHGVFPGSCSFGSVSSSPNAESCCSRLLVVKSENLPMFDAAA